MMTSTKCLDFNYFESVLDTLFRWKNFPKRLRKIFGVIDSELTVNLACKVMMTSLKCCHFNDFELFSYPLVRTSIFERD